MAGGSSLGNGRLGAMVYGEPFAGRIQMNEESVVYGGPIDRNNPDARKNLDKIRGLLREGKIEEAEELSVYALSGTPQSQRPFQTLGEFSYRIYSGEGGDTGIPGGKGEITDYRREPGSGNRDRRSSLYAGFCHLYNESVHFSGGGSACGGIFIGQAGRTVDVRAADKGKVL